MNSARVEFSLSLADGRSYECVGRLVYVAPPRQRGRYSVDTSPSPPELRWLIHVLAGPDLYDQMDKQNTTLGIALSDGRAGRVVVTDGATLRGVTDLVLPT